MLNVFPELLFLAPLAAVLIRGAVAAIFILAALAHYKKGVSHLLVLAALEVLTGILLAIGLYTQVATILGVILIGIWLWSPSTRIFPMSTVLLSLVLALSLLVTGSGPISFDLPL